MKHKIISIVLFATAIALFVIIFFLEFQISPYWGMFGLILLVASFFAEHFSQENGEDYEYLEERPDWFRRIERWVGEPALVIGFIALLTNDLGLPGEILPWWGKTALLTLVCIGGVNVLFQLKAIRREHLT